MAIKFGPAGLGPVNTAEKILETYSKLGLQACEIAFTYSVYVNNKEDFERIGQRAKELGISLSIHAPYFVNLNSADKVKREESKKRILACCEAGHYLGAKTIVFHPGYYGKSGDRQADFQAIKQGISEMMAVVKQNGWNVKLAPETMGKVNVFGSIEEISRLVKETGCSFCIDFAHILARDKKVDFYLIKKLFPEEKWHCHFSGIVYSDKGEKHHKTTEKEEWQNLLENLPKDKDITIINESPTLVEDSVNGLKIYKKLI